MPCINNTREEATLASRTGGDMSSFAPRGNDSGMRDGNILNQIISVVLCATSTTLFLKVEHDTHIRCSPIIPGQRILLDRGQQLTEYVHHGITI
jgi:hypothetical protein